MAVAADARHLVRLAGGGELDELCVYQGPVIIEPALVLPADFLCRALLTPLWTSQVDTAPPGQFVVTVGGNLAVRIPPP
ncbi:hypothetical protein [Synechococcus sp. SynAce01]|uniref:hypothetical protein n=1 Tax=Synechococcus sp. SynAce01 TaxID=1916956 RepID=UPI0013C4FDED|nr:hypothetical protein [Synechococcus sp. SynAce01]